MKRIGRIGWFVLCCFAVVGWAVPTQINYRGRLFESGSPVTGTRSFEFRIFDAAVGGAQLWTSGTVNLAVNQGLYNYTLGTNPALPSAVFTNDLLYLEVRVAGTPLSPRERLVAVPYAARARMVRGTNVFPAAGYAGIGTSSPSRALDVVGRVVASNYQFKTAKTYHVALPAAAFRLARTNGTGTGSLHGQGYWHSLSTSNIILHAPLADIPNGAQIMGIDFYFYSQAGNINPVVALKGRSPPWTLLNDIASTTGTLSSPGAVQTIYLAVNATVNKLGNEYVVSVLLAPGAVASIRFYGARVYYTLNEVSH